MFSLSQSAIDQIQATVIGGLILTFLMIIVRYIWKKFKFVKNKPLSESDKILLKIYKKSIAEKNSKFFISDFLENKSQLKTILDYLQNNGFIEFTSTSGDGKYQSFFIKNINLSGQELAKKLQEHE